MTPIGAVQAGGGYDVAWKDTASGLYTAWSTDSNGNYLSNSARLREPARLLEFARDDLQPGPQRRWGDRDPKVDIQTDGSTSLAQVGDNYFLNPVAGGTGPELQISRCRGNGW